MSIVEEVATRLLHPASQALLLGVVSTLLVYRRQPGLALVFALVAVGWLWTASTPWLALRLRDGLIVSTAPAPPRPRVDAIVVLGGGALPRGDWSRPSTRAGMGLTLWRHGVAPLLVISGSDQAQAMARGLIRAGVPGAALRLEDRSTNTHENARNTAALLQDLGDTDVLLVTSPIHMRRAMACFRHEAVVVTPAPALDGSETLREAPPWMPRRDALTLTALSVHEYVALWSYQRRGWL